MYLCANKCNRYSVRMSQRIPLIIAFTPSYFIPAATVLKSVLETSEAGALYEVICLMSEPLSQDMQERMRLIDGGSGQLSFRFWELRQEDMAGCFVDPKYTLAANFRLIIADRLPEYDKAIYLDCDIIVRQDLAKLYREVELGDNYLAGVAETSEEYQIKAYEPLGCKAGEYINSGFLVMNLKLLRQDQMAQKFMDALRVPYLTFPDQDVLNSVCRGRILYLPIVYNGIRSFMLPGFRPTFLRYHTLEAWHQVRREGTIHYTGEKPWRAYTLLFEKWWQCYWRLPKAVRQGIAVERRVERLARLFSLPGVRPLANFVLDLRRRV